MKQNQWFFDKNNKIKFFQRIFAFEVSQVYIARCLWQRAWPTMLYPLEKNWKPEIRTTSNWIRATEIGKWIVTVKFDFSKDRIGGRVYSLVSKDERRLKKENNTESRGSTLCSSVCNKSKGYLSRNRYNLGNDVDFQWKNVLPFSAGSDRVLDHIRICTSACSTFKE